MHYEIVNNFWKLHIESSIISVRCAIGTHDSAGRSILHRKGNFSPRAIESLRSYIPYCIHWIDNDSDDLIWLNRDYNPLGVNIDRIFSISTVDYKKFPHLHVNSSDPAIETLKENCIFRKQYSNVKHGIYWLFNDRTSPFINKSNATEYLKKLELIDFKINED